MIRKLYRYTQYAAIATGLAAVPMVGQACPSNPLVGSVCFTAINFCPYGYFSASGQTVNIQSYAALYSLLGTKFGGDGKTTFGLPDLRGRAPIGANDQKISSGGVMISPTPLATLRGQESVVLATSQVPLPPHTHSATFTGTGGGSGPAQASGNVSIPVAVAVPSQNVSVSGNVKIANSSASGQQLVSANAVLAKGASPASIYAPASSTSADTNIGPTQTFTGSTTATTVNTTAAGLVTLPVTGGGITGGTVTVSPAGTNASASVPLISPQQALTACIAWNGLYPERP